jgi:Zn-dependent protease
MIMILSFFLCIGVYAVVFSWKFAIVLMGSLLWHEYGHIWAMQRCGLKTKGIYFIPFIGGAAIGSDRMPTRDVDVVVSLMGPIFGLALAVLTAFVYAQTGLTIIAAAALFMIILNVFNLIPIYPLDGGRVLWCFASSIPPALGSAVMLLSVVFAVWVTYVTRIPLLFLIVFFSVISFSQFRKIHVYGPRIRPFLQRIKQSIASGQLKRDSWEYMQALHVLGFVFDGNHWYLSGQKLKGLPSYEEVDKAAKNTIEFLAQPVPLSALGIAKAFLAWIAVVYIYLQLLVVIVQVPGVFDALVNM